MEGPRPWEDSKAVEAAPCLNLDPIKAAPEYFELANESTQVWRLEDEERRQMKHQKSRNMLVCSHICLPKPDE